MTFSKHASCGLPLRCHLGYLLQVGCVRAFVVDAFSYNFNVMVVEDGVADRFDFAHAGSL